VSVHTNNGVESQNKAFKHDYLAPYKSKSLSNLVTCLVEDFFQDSYRRYVLRLCVSYVLNVIKAITSIRPTIVQHSRASDLELTATCCVNCHSNYFQNQTYNVKWFLLFSVNCSTHLFRQRLCSGVTALRRCINGVLGTIIMLLSCR